LPRVAALVEPVVFAVAPVVARWLVAAVPSPRVACRFC
jgi:hypothetical protein